MVRSLVLLVLVLATAARGDVLTLVNGSTIEGRILREDTTEIEVQTNLGTVILARKDITTIERKPFADPSKPGATHAGGPRGRLPDAAAVRRALPQNRWAKGVKQVPAAVVTKGPFKNVPYLSYRADEDYEVNIYGDPAAPVAIEVGLLNMRTRNEDARTNAQAFLASLLGTPEDRVIVEKLGREKDDQVREGLTFQVQPPESDRSYGAWWIRVLDDRTMEMERASAEEINAITVTRGTQDAPPRPGQRPYIPKRKPEGPAPGGEPWTSAEMRSTRDLPEATRGVARVYVREFIRKEGAYARTTVKEP